jgi:hypothetical protein
MRHWAFYGVRVVINGFAGARPEKTTSRSLSEMLITQQARILHRVNSTIQNHHVVGSTRMANKRKEDPYSNAVLRRVMKNFLAAVEEGKVKVKDTPREDTKNIQPSETRAGGGMDGLSSNRTLKLMLASFLEKSVIYKIPFPGVHIDGVPDEDDQARLIETRT